MKVHFLRHCLSEFNHTKIDNIDCELVEEGKTHARSLVGNYDLVICSPLRRCKQTLEYSQIQYKKLITLEVIREHKINCCDFLEGEEVIYEDEESLLERIKEFKRVIEQLGEEHKNILVVTHSDFVFYLTSKLVDGERLVCHFPSFNFTQN